MDIIAKNRNTLGFFTALLAPAAIAGTMGPAIPSMGNHWVMAVSGAAVWASAGKTQTFYLTPEIEKTWLAEKSNRTLPQGELFLGIQRELSAQIILQGGLALVATGNMKLGGEIWDDADPQFNNYTYRYKINHSHVAAKAKILVDKYPFVTPWISASLGAGFNRATNFSNTPVIFEAIATPDFAAHTTTALTYNLGLGIQKNLKNNLQLSLGYEFADWGQSHLNPAPQQTLNRGLALNHLYTNALVLGLAWLF